MVVFRYILLSANPPVGKEVNLATFEIVIQRKSGDAWPVAATHQRAVDFLPTRAEGLLALDLETVLASPTPREYGRALGEALFRDTLRDAFRDALSLARAGGNDSRLRVLLTVEDPDLKGLHWERLWAPFGGGSGWDFLSLHQETPFSLYLPSLADRNFPPFGRRDLRALVLVAGPGDLVGDYGLEPFDVPAAVRAVRDGLGEIPNDLLANIAGAAGLPDLNTLCRRLTEESYTLLHIVCHGQYVEKQRETVLYLPGDEGKPVNGRQLIDRLANLQGARGLPRLAFLMACESANPRAEIGFGGLGHQLVRELGMPAVLAMTARVTIQTANALAGEFYRRLGEHGEPDRALGEALAGLQGRPDASVPAIFSRLGGRPLFSDELDRPLTPSEVSYGLERLLAECEVRAPALREQTAGLAQRLGSRASSAGLSPAELAEHQSGLVEAGLVSEEVTGVSFAALALGKPLPAYDARCPFPGLAPFQPGDRAFFFGRDPLVNDLLARLKEHPFLSIVGASGSGKSSLALAGLVPHLAAEGNGSALVAGAGEVEPGSVRAGMDPSGVAVFTPGSQPFARLQAALARVPPGAPVVADQFEELFTLCRSEGERKAFLAELLDLAGQRKVILTLRADFLGECAAYPELKKAVQAHTELVAPMDAAELRRAMEQQASAAGLRFEADLAEDILDDVHDEPGAMPLLQHALLELWQRRHGRWLRTAEYRALGGVRAAIAHTADEIYTGLDEAERGRMRSIFVRLTRLDEDPTPGIERRDTRRRVSLAELVPAGSERLATVELVRRLASARLVTTGFNPAGGQEEVEVSHEALIRHWPRLRRWLEEDRAGLRMGETVREAAQDWAEANRDENLLIHRGGRLDDALELAGAGRYVFNQQEVDYLSACKALRERERAAGERRRRITIFSALGVAAVMFFLALWGFGQARVASNQAATATSALAEARQSAATATFALGLSEQRGTEAAQQAATAQAEAEISLARQLAVQSQDITQRVPAGADLAALLAVEALRRAPELSGTQALMQALELIPKTTILLADCSLPDALFNGDGSLLALACTGRVALLDETGMLLHEVPAGDAVNLQSFIADGERLLFLEEDKRLVSLDVATGQVVGRVDLEIGPENQTDDPKIYGLGINAGEKYTAAPFSDSTVHVWDTSTGKLVRQIVIESEVQPWEIQPYIDQEAGILYAFQFNKKLSAWDIITGEQMMLTDVSMVQDTFFADLRGGWLVVPGASTRVETEMQLVELRTGYVKTSFWPEAGEEVVQISQDGQYLVTRTQGYLVRLRRTRDGVADTQMMIPSGALQVLLSPDNQRLLSFHEDNTLQLWDVATGRRTALQANTFNGGPILFHPDSRWVLSSAVTNDFDTFTMQIWSANPAQDTYREEFDSSIVMFDFSQDGRLAVVSSGYPGEAVVSSSPGGAELFQTSFYSPLDASLSQDGKQLLTVENQGHLILWNIADGSSRAYPEYEGYTQAAGLSPDGQVLVWINTVGEVQLREISTGRVIYNSFAEQDGLFPAYLFAFSTDSRYLVLTGSRSGVAGVDVQAGRLSGRFNQTGSVTSLDISPDSRRVVTGADDGSVWIWDLATQEILLKVEIGYPVADVRFSQDGRRILVAGDSGEVRVANAFNGETIRRILHSKPLMYDSFSPDGRWVLSTSEDGQAKVWEAASGVEIARLEANLVPEPRFTPDGGGVVLAQGNVLRVVSWQPEDLIRQACERIRRSLSEEEWRQYLGERPYRATCP